MTWKRVEDELPPAGELLLYISDAHDPSHRWFGIGGYVGGDIPWELSFYEIPVIVTHWHPLPSPPTEE